MICWDTNSNDSNSARSKAEKAFAPAEDRAQSLKDELAKEQAQAAAKTANLKELRLAKEAADRDVAGSAPLRLTAH